MALLKRIQPKEKARFFYQFAALLDAGTGIQRSLELASKEFPPALKHYCQRVSAAVGEGCSLASALALESGYLDSWTIGLIRLAEYSGSLPQTCHQLAQAAEAQQRHNRLYRSVRLSAIIILWSLLILAAAIFTRTPSGLLNPEFWFRSVGIGLLLLLVSFLASRYSSRGSQQLVMKLPGLGKISQAQSLIHLARLRLPLSCGVSLLAAIELARSHLPDRVMAARLAKALRDIRAGQTLSQSLQGKLPPVAVQMLRRGEETGNLDSALENLAAYYEGELERRLRRLQGSLRVASLFAIAALVAVVGIRGIRVLLDSLPG
jgi:type II secretory pathway component PulF